MFFRNGVDGRFCMWIGMHVFISRVVDLGCVARVHNRDIDILPDIFSVLLSGADLGRHRFGGQLHSRFDRWIAALTRFFAAARLMVHSHEKSLLFKLSYTHSYEGQPSNGCTTA